MSTFVVGVASTLSLALSLGGMHGPPVEVVQPELVPESEPAEERAEDPASEDRQTDTEPPPATPDDAPEAGEAEPEAEPTDEAPDKRSGEPSMQDALFDEALARYVEGIELFEAQRFLDAAAAYERSYAAVPAGPTLYGAALSYEKGGKLVRAIKTYGSYLKLPDCPAPRELCAASRIEVTETVRKLMAQVGVLAIKVDPGVELRGIDVEERMVPVEEFPLLLAPGTYELRVHGIERGQERVRIVDVEKGQRTSLLVTDFDAKDPIVTAPVRTDPVQPPRVTAQERRRRLRIAFYSGVGLTAAGVVAFSVMGGLTARAFNRQNERCKGEGESCMGTMYPRENRERVDTLRPVTNTLIGVTAGLGIVTTVIGLFAFSKRDAPNARARVTHVRPTSDGFRIHF